MEPNPTKSRRPSAGPPAKPPETAATFFIDRDTGGRLLAGELRNHGYTVVLHDDTFPQNTPDRAWIRDVAERGWLILTCDRNIARKEPERSLFGTAPTHTFILYALTQVKRAERVGLVLAVLPKLTKLVAEGARHGIYRVYSDGRIERVVIQRTKFRLEDF